MKDSMQKPLYENPDRPKQRELFWESLETESFDNVINKYALYGIKERLKDKVKKFVYGRKNAK